MIHLLDKNHPGEVGRAIDHLWVGGFLQAKGVDVYCISSMGLDEFNGEILTDA
jgi:hypothetical protein